MEAKKEMNLIPFKQWVTEEAQKRGVKPSTLYNYYTQGQYPHIIRKVVNQRVMFVDLDDQAQRLRDESGLGPHNDPLSMKVL